MQELKSSGSLARLDGVWGKCKNLGYLRLTVVVPFSILADSLVELQAKLCLLGFLLSPGTENEGTGFWRAAEMGRQSRKAVLKLSASEVDVFSVCEHAARSTLPVPSGS